MGISRLWLRSVALVVSVLALSAPVHAMDQITSREAQVLEAGEYNTCALMSPGEVYCWGRNDQYQNYPSVNGRFVSVSAALVHACGILNDGKLSCWGSSAAIGTPPSSTTYRAVAAGEAGSCALRTDGRLACWGGAVAETAPLDDTFLKVSVSRDRACAVRSDGALVCWQAVGTAGFGPAPTGAFLDVAISQGHACALRSDGAVLCWGNNTYGQAAPPQAERFVAITVGFQHSCGIVDNGGIRCWGNNPSGQLDSPAGRFTAISAGRAHTCARAIDGGLECWGGDNLNAELEKPRGTFRQIEVGGGEACAIDTGGNATCRGDLGALQPAMRYFMAISIGEQSACGLLQDGRASCWGVPFAQMPTEPMDSLSVGSTHGCGIGYGYEPVCWGDNTYGQLNAPTGRYTKIVSGDRFSCGITTIDARLVCWGSGTAVTAAPTGSGFRDISAHAGNVCVVDADYRARCWGGEAQLANTPTQTVGRVTVGAHHACALYSQGNIVCWGDNAHGQRNVPASGGFLQMDAAGDTTCAISEQTMNCWGERTYEANVPGVRTGNQALASGRTHTCGHENNGAIACWGDDALGQRQPPVQPLRSMDAYADHACALDGDNLVRCWGDNAANGSTPPVERARIAGVGERNGCAIRTDGSLGCWGWNSNGQSVPPAGAFRSVATGLNHSCGVRDDGTLACWGYNADGQSSPPAGLYRDVDVGERHSCAIAADGSARCWGLDSEGQSTPPDIAGVTYVALAVGAFHNCGITGHGDVVCWGRNTAGQATAPLEGKYVAISAGNDHTCAIAESGVHACWGSNASGQAPVPVITPTVLPPAVLGQPYKVDLRMTATGGYLPPGPQFKFGGGALPFGILYTPYGQVRGTAAGTTGTYAFSVIAQDENGFRDQRTFQFQVVRPPDVTPPLIQARINGEFTTREWFNTNVRLEWFVSDDGSDVTSTNGCTTITVETDTAGLAFTCTATSDGGTSAKTVTIRRDTVPPDTILLSGPPPVSYERVNSATFTFTSPGDDSSGLDGFECSADFSQYIVPCTSPYTRTDLITDTQYTMYIRARDRAGNVDPTPVKHTWVLHNDYSPPDVTPIITGTLGDNGWYRSEIQLRWSLTDPESIASVYIGCNGLTVTSDTYSVSDLCWARSAGGQSERIATLKRDATPPLVQAVASTAPNAQGWYRQDVAINFPCSDAMSGITQPCPPAEVLSQEGRGISSTAKSVRDMAGNVASSGVVTVNLDKTPPTMSAIVDRQPNAAGWYRSNVVVSFPCADALSGLADPCPIDKVVSTEGREVLAAGIVGDVAGNYGGASVPINLDKTAPSISALATAQPNVNGWYRDNVSIFYVCSDNLSGIAEPCPAPQAFSQEGVSSSTSYSVADRAGNVSAPSNTVTVRIDKTSPVLTATMPVGDVLLNATHAFNLAASDALSGVASQSCSGFDSSTPGTRSATCTATDRAGNTTTRTSTYRVIYGFVPLSAPLTNPSTTYVVAAPRSVPFEWRLQDANGAPIASATLQQAVVTAVTCPDAGVALPTPAAGETNTFENFSDGRYRRNWWINYAGVSQCLRLDVTLNDGVTRSGIVRVVPKIVRRSTPLPSLPAGTRSSASSPATSARPAVPVRRALIERGRRR